MGGKEGFRMAKDTGNVIWRESEKRENKPRLVVGNVWFPAN